MTNESFNYKLIARLLQTWFLDVKNYIFTNRKYMIFYKQNSYELTNFMLTFQNTCNLRKTVSDGSKQDKTKSSGGRLLLLFLRCYYVFQTFEHLHFKTLVILF